MKAFDRKIKELSRKIEVPKEYSKKLEEVLENLPEEDKPSVTKKHTPARYKLVFAACMICVVCFLGMCTIEANADIFETFRMTIMDIFHLSDDSGDKDIGIDSNHTDVESKPDLMLEMQETVIDANGIYLLVKITAPTSIEFEEKIKFDYFAFCEGSNYNADKLIGGTTDCYLLEVMPGRHNVATYVLTLSTDMTPYLGQMVTAYCKDLMFDPYGDAPKLLVEGMWSISFSADATVRDSVHFTGGADVTFPFQKTTAYVESIDLTPLGMTILYNVSNVPFADLSVTDTSISLYLKMIDGSRVCVTNSDSDEPILSDGGNIEYSEADGQSYQKETYSFSSALDINKVAGFYIQEVYVPLN